MKTDITPRPPEYQAWLSSLKIRLRSARLKAATVVNEELLSFYWGLGHDIIRKQRGTSWGSGFLKNLSQDLRREFPEMKGFSLRNLKYIRRWVLYYSNETSLAARDEESNGQQAVAHLNDPRLRHITQIPWGHNLVIITKCKCVDEALFYVQNTLIHGWSRSVLTHQLESELWQRKGKAITNFSAALAPAQSDLAQETLKDPYVFDFLALTEDHNERELERALVANITQFLLELGVGFAYIGRQVPIQVGERDFFLDLLFYHTRLRCYVVVELKIVDFEPEHAGKLNFYLKAVDSQMKHPDDAPSIGMLLCKNKDRTVVEYALSDVHKPIGVSEYQLTHSLPETLRSNLPSIEALEAELDFDEVSSED